jgi:hypothetical protein
VEYIWNTFSVTARTLPYDKAVDLVTFNALGMAQSQVALLVQYT